MITTLHATIGSRSTVTATAASLDVKDQCEMGPENAGSVSRHMVMFGWDDETAETDEQAFGVGFDHPVNLALVRNLIARRVSDRAAAQYGSAD